MFTEGNIPRASTLSIDTNLIVHSSEVSELYNNIWICLQRAKFRATLRNPTRGSINTSLIVGSSEVSELYNNICFFIEGNMPCDSTKILQEEVSIPDLLYVLLKWVSCIIIFGVFIEGNIPCDSTLILQEEVSIPDLLYVLLKWVSCLILFGFVYRWQHSAWLYPNTTRGSIDTSLIVNSSEVNVWYW